MRAIHYRQAAASTIPPFAHLSGHAAGGGGAGSGGGAGGGGGAGTSFPGAPSTPLAPGGPTEPLVPFTPLGPCIPGSPLAPCSIPQLQSIQVSFL